MTLYPTEMLLHYECHAAVDLEGAAGLENLKHIPLQLNCSTKRPAMAKISFLSILDKFPHPWRTLNNKMNLSMVIKDLLTHAVGMAF